MTPNREMNRNVPLAAAALLDDAFDAAAIFTAADSPVAAQIVYVNDAHLRLSGYARDELVGHSSVLLAGAKPELEHVREIEQNGRRERFTGVTRKHRPDGTAYVVEVRIRPLHDADGAASHMLLLQREIAVAPPGEDRARLLRAEVVAAERLAAGAAYELEGPVSRLGVSLRSALVSIFADGESDLLADFQEAARAVEHLESTVRGLRAFAGGEDADEGLDVHEAIEIAAHFASVEVAARATLHRAYAPVPRARGSTSRLTQVLTALLRNAAQSIPRATPWANSVTVQTGVTADGLVSIEIADTGIGIEPADLPFVFDPFFTTKPTRTSPGLGLAAARAAVLAMGGDITVESEVGRGSRFCVVLPAARTAPSAPARYAEVEPPRVRRVLCVTESIADARRLKELVDDGESHFLFATASEAVERLSLGDELDLVLCEARAFERFEIKDQISRLAPHALARTFAIALRSSVSGTFTVPAASAAGRMAHGTGR
jgi:PAS domain S-box-containing protein